MRGAHQICEGSEFEDTLFGPSLRYCLSYATWKVVTDWLIFFCCTRCHERAELEFVEKGVPRTSYFSEQGFRPHAGHEAACERHAAASAGINDR